jgi:Flp pilus assembly protein TadD
MKKLEFGFLISLVVSAVYVGAWPAPNLIYGAAVIFHTGIGLLFAGLGLWLLPRAIKQGGLIRAAAILLAIGTIGGLVLIPLGATRPHLPLFLAHIIFCAVAVALLVAYWFDNRRGSLRISWLTIASVMILTAAVGGVAWYARESWSEQYVIHNPSEAPISMDGEGDGPKGPFFPSSAQVANNEMIPSKFFMESDACTRCHADIYQEWSSSAHHFSSFNNQWYRKSIEYMQEVKGTKPSKWCGGCHDPAVLYSGLMDTPIKQVVNRPESQAGLGCMMCHSIVKVKSTMGQGDFRLEYPKLHELAATKNPVMRWLHDFSVRLNPEAHRRVFLKPFMRDQTSEFCSSCHKVHLDVPVNGYRWIRGFNEYDNWQASGVSFQGARSFYYPPVGRGCADCHMPAVKSNDIGNVNGMIHSHAFPAANTAVPTANQDEKQLKLVEDFLTSGIVTVDVFAISHVAPSASAGVSQSETATTFAVGEEAETKTSGVSNDVPVAPITAPLDRTDAALRRGESVRIDVVVRTKGVGHFFPGGTVDAFDTWLELKAVDDKGQTIFWSGKVEDDGKGPVEKGAHFYRSLQIDEHGNPINKRNAWSTRSVVYVRLIPPGAADTVHFRVKVPDWTANKITFTAKLCYRKFSWWNTHFAYAGIQSDPNGKEMTADYDDRPVIFSGDTSTVSGKIKAVPDLPIVVIAKNSVDVRVLPKNAPADASRTIVKKEDWQRWNDYGIGFLLQGDLKSAAAAFQKVTEADPSNPDGWVNIGRAALQEGDVERAREVLKRALSVSPNLARAHFFYAKVLRTDGNYDEALQHLQIVLAQYPKDRVVLNEAGRILFLERKYKQAIEELQKVMEIDPEDLQGNYNLALCYRGLGDNDRAATYEKLYLRFKANEAAQALTGKYDREHPEDNNERQAIHEHVSISLPAPTKIAKETSHAPQVASARLHQDK